MVMCAVGERQVCKECGHNFGTDEAKKCNSCLAYICPKCQACNCVLGVAPLEDLRFSRN